MKVLAVVPAKADSRGVPMKNLCPLGARPLWAIAVDQALAAGCDKVVVSTNEPGIIHSRAALKDKVYIHDRPEALCGTAPVERTIDAVLDIHEGYGCVVMLNPTHPFRRVTDIRACIWDVVHHHCASSLAVKEDYQYGAEEGEALGGTRGMNRQLRNPRLLVTGSIYASDVGDFIRTGSLMHCPAVRVVPPPHVDIDTDDDYQMARILWPRWEEKNGV